MLTREKLLRLRRHPKGFSLIELGIVIAVIAVLAAVVIFGRGFIAAGRVSKAVEGLNTIRKASATFAGLQGGSFQPQTRNGCQVLADRDLLPPSAKTPPWTIAGGGNNSFIVTNIQFGQGGTGGRQNAIAVSLQAPDATGGEDVFSSVSIDQNFLKTGMAAGQNCSAAGGQTMILCFTL